MILLLWIFPWYALWRGPMTAANILWLIVGLILGAGVGLLAMCLVAMGKLGENELPDPQSQIVRHYQD